VLEYIVRLTEARSSKLAYFFILGSFVGISSFFYVYLPTVQWVARHFFVYLLEVYWVARHFFIILWNFVEVIVKCAFIAEVDIFLFYVVAVRNLHIL